MEQPYRVNSNSKGSISYWLLIGFAKIFTNMMWYITTEANLLYEVDRCWHWLNEGEFQQLTVISAYILSLTYSEKYKINISYKYQSPEYRSVTVWHLH